MAISLLAAPTTAHGQKGYAMGIGGGAAIPVGKLGDVQKTGYSALVALALGSADLPIGFRLDGIYNNLTHTNTPTGTTSADFRVAGAIVNLVYAFPGTYAKPYVVAGTGWYRSKVDTADAKAQSNIGFNAGLGTTFGFGPAAAFVEARYHTISRSVAKGGVFQFVPITFGLLF
ncbi:MAG TPA: outer membrane beta-barrel protein [Gemmatimonadaceae bacterium]|nr:outer membrane beta-barrel protein [Gemmatimonadaceae bacterium]